MIRAARAGMRVVVDKDDFYFNPPLRKGTEAMVVAHGALGTGFGPFVYLKTDDGAYFHTYKKNVSVVRKPQPSRASAARDARRATGANVRAEIRRRRSK